jgi:hypothetical protein
MSGLILIFIIVLWIMVVKKLTSLFTKAMPVNGFTLAIKVLVFALLFVSPFADEIIGGFQFRALCKQGYSPVYDEAKAKGKLVFLKDTPDKRVQNSIIPIREESWEYADINTRELLLSWKEYHAKGGWLSRIVGFPEGSPPYTFNAVCSSEGNYPLLKHLNMKTINRDKNHE